MIKTRVLEALNITDPTIRKMDQASLIQDGQRMGDQRVIRFFNSFEFKDIRRFHIIKQPRNFLCAWGENKLEIEYFNIILANFYYALMVIQMNLRL